MRISEGVGWGTISLLCRKSVLLLCQNNSNMAKKERKLITPLRRFKVQKKVLQCQCTINFRKKLSFNM